HTLASASADGSARLWDLRSGRLVATLQSKADRAHCVAFAPDGQSLAVGYGGGHGLVQWWGLEPLVRRESWAAHPRVTRCLTFHPDGQTLATGGDGPALRVWELPGLKLRELTAGAPSAASAVAFRPDGQHLAWLGSRP